MYKKKRILFLSQKELKSFQDKKLHSFITRHLYPFSTHYRKLLDKHKINPDSIRRVQDLKNIPFTSKNDFQSQDGKESLEFILQPSEELIRRYLPKKGLAYLSLIKLLKGKKYLKHYLGKEYRPIFLTSTAGTTGQPVPFLYAKHDLENLKIYGSRISKILCIKPDDRMISVFPYAPHLAFWQVVFAGLGGNRFILSTGGGKTLGTQGNINVLMRLKAQFLIGVPSYVYHILKKAESQGLKLPFLNNIILGASRVPKGFKRKIVHLLSKMGAKEVKVIGSYGFTESRAAWVECPTSVDISSGYHIYPDKEIFEVIDPRTGQVLGEGSDGELVYTSIDARGSCVLRYRTGDLVKGGIVYSACPYCNRTVPRISSDIVRASNVRSIQLTKVKGTLINFNNLEHILDDTEEIGEWQIEIVKKNNDPYEVDELLLNIALFRSVNKEEFASVINRKIFTACEVSFNKIAFITDSKIKKMIQIESAVKAKKIIDKRPQVKGV